MQMAGETATPWRTTSTFDLIQSWVKDVLDSPAKYYLKIGDGGTNPMLLSQHSKYIVPFNLPAKS